MIIPLLPLVCGDIVSNEYPYVDGADYCYKGASEDVQCSILPIVHFIVIFHTLIHLVYEVNPMGIINF